MEGFKMKAKVLTKTMEDLTGKQMKLIRFRYKYVEKRKDES